MKKLVALMMALVMALSCATFAVAEDAPTSLSVCLSSEPDTLDPALNSAVDGATMIAHLFAGLSTWAQDENGALVIEPLCATELPEGVANEDGTVTYTYTLVDGLTWSDGKALTAKDFEFAWKRAASSALGADYGYMFEVVKGYPDELAVEATDDKTLVVTLNNAVAYWNELLAFPTYLPVREDVVANEAWATDPSTYICNGPYSITAWEHSSVITLTKNANYFKADTIKLDELKCFLSDDSNNMLANFENGDWLLIDDVPTAEIANLKVNYPTEFVIAGQIGTYYVCWNVNEEILPEGCELTGAEAEAAKAEIRNALGLLFDRNYICEEIGQAGQVPASSFVAMGLTDADGSEFYKNTGVSEEFVGYYNTSVDAYLDNWDAAIATLKKYYTYDEATGMFTNFPTLEYLYNTSDGHKAIGEYLQSALAGVGITMTLTNQEWNTFLNTRKEGDYSIARNGWLADYNDPICFLDMWVSISGNNDVQYGKGAHADLAMYNLDLTAYGYDVKVENGTWAETYDVLINTIKSCTNNEARYAMMHIAEDMLMATGCIVPLYFYTDIYMIDDSIEGFFSNPLGYKYFMYCTIAK
ncbi:MAG: peptide ABC transporter substrate-binding protein [Clostridia bacterium]|nr:peptide ABC transporter substrate-binding protein [Clostridia bacterium]MBQ6805666.1 peptide ABC transporter substrate-binding protein [Clostridia bacterium]